MMLAPVGVPFGTVPSSPSHPAGTVAANASTPRPASPPAFPPVHVHPLDGPSPANVNPTGYYSSEPAPMGIGDFGIGASGNAYTYSTSQFLGNFSWQSLNLDLSGNTQFTDQLNVVLQFVQNGITYAYWIQDVAFMDSSTGELTFENNIWNFTSSCLDNSAVQGNGTVYSYSGCQGYYAVGATTQPGADEFMPSPGDFGLLVRANETVGGLPEVAFEYWDGVTSYYVTYDNVVFPWASGLSSDNNFVVDGFSYNPIGLYYDAELTIGGPGGGSATQAQDLTHATSRLLYWNGHNFEATPAVWNFGSNTAEAVSNIQSIFSHDGAGLPLTLQLNGTTRDAAPAMAYDQNAVGELAISAPGISSGTVAIPGDTWSFVGDSASLTLAPGTYQVWVNSTSQTYDLGLCAVQAGVTLSTSTASGCGPVVSTPTASTRGADLGQAVTFQSTLLAPGSGGDTYVWHTSPVGLGCTPSSTLTLSCMPAATGTYAVNLTVTDSDGHSSTSRTLQFIVSTDPTVAAPVPSPSEVETGESVTFTASPSGGAQPYAYQWHGLPAPCSGATGSTPSCVPATAGSYSVSVTVTDANTYSVTSGTTSFTVLQGPSVSTPVAAPTGSIDLHQTVTFSTTASGGSGGYAYAWIGLPAGCSSTSTASLACTPTSVGIFSVQVQVLDSLGGSATSGALVYTVHTDPTMGVLTATPATIDLGQTLQFSLSGASMGGAGSYRYVWSGLPGGCASNNAITLTCVPTANGSGSAVVTVYDADGGTNATTVAWTVFSDPSLSGVIASPSRADVGQSVAFDAWGLSGGTGSFVYRWSGLPTGCSGRNVSVVDCATIAPGTFAVTVNVTDTNGFSTSRSVTVTVDPDPTVGTPTATPGSVTVGHSVTFSVSASGGSGGFVYFWSGLPPGCESANATTVTCQPSAAGTYNVMVSVTDSNGFNVLVGPLAYVVSSSSPTFLGLPALVGYAVVAVGVAVVALIVIAALVWRSRRGGSPPAP
jgi:hypothetical protein